MEESDLTINFDGVPDDIDEVSQDTDKSVEPVDSSVIEEQPVKKSKKVPIIIGCVAVVAIVLTVLSTCTGRSDEAKAADKAIRAIGTITLSSEEAIESAESLVSELSSEDYDSLRRIDSLFNARLKYDTLVVEDAIDAIGTVTLESEELIVAARSAYEDSTKDVKAAVSNYSTLENAESELVEQQQIAEATAIETAINEIGTVTLDSDKAISAARKAYDKADDNVKKLVSNYNVLESGEKEFNEIETVAKVAEVEAAINDIGKVTIDSESTISTARHAYNHASDEAKARISNYGILEEAEKEIEEIKLNAVIQEAEDAIDAIGTVTLSSYSAIETARNKYNAVPEAARFRVTNYDVLVEAEETIAALRKQQLNEAMSRMNIKRDEVEECTFYYPTAYPQYRNSRCYVLPFFILTDSGDYGIAITYNYSGRSWVFFTDVIISVDGEKYEKSFSYFDVSRDVGGLRVAETINEVADGFDWLMLWDIASSENTIIRFKGDDSYYDYTVSESDKTAMDDILYIQTWYKLYGEF